MQDQILELILSVVSGGNVRMNIRPIVDGHIVSL